ncbi:MAG: hypothetical protein H0T62_02335 [Parachlamydiaceae bacterium]|nr:hypothetical protein [Parachlamydiaceae bacterium]
MNTQIKYELPNNLNTYKSAVYTIKDLPQMSYKKESVGKFFEPANTYLIDSLTKFLTDNTIKILSKIPIATDPVSFEQLTGIVQKKEKC